MNKRNAYISIMLALAVSGLGLTACDGGAAREAEQEFVCYDDGVLVERHVEVEYARTSDAARWYIKYTDGQMAWYQQPAGETCQVESYTPKN